MNMHLYWVGVGADLWRAGDRALEWILRGAIESLTPVWTYLGVHAMRSSDPAAPKIVDVFHAPGDGGVLDQRNLDVLGKHSLDKAETLTSYLVEPILQVVDAVFVTLQILSVDFRDTVSGQTVDLVMNILSEWHALAFFASS
jgi:hypothetical protein